MLLVGSDDEVFSVRCGVVYLLFAAELGVVPDQRELFGDCMGCTLKYSCTKLKSCLCWKAGGKNGFPPNSEEVGVGIVLLTEMSLGELKLKFCNVGVPVLLGGSDLPVSISLISLESISVDPYKTKVDSCVGK